MGGLLSSGMSKAMEKNLDNMKVMQDDMFERQKQMQNYMREQAMAMQIARMREMVRWSAAGYGVITLMAIGGFKRKRNPAVFAPLVPLGFILCYQLHMAHGDKMTFIRSEAEKIVREEGYLLDLPTGIPTKDVISDRAAGYQRALPPAKT